MHQVGCAPRHFVGALWLGIQSWLGANCPNARVRRIKDDRMTSIPPRRRPNYPPRERLAICERPGCYEAPRASRRSPSSYCGDACREAMRRVRDRERKYLRRMTNAGRLKRRLEYAAAAKKHLPSSAASSRTWRFGEQHFDSRTRIAVGGYRCVNPARVTFRESTHLGPSGVAGHDSQTHSPPSPRAPPSEGCPAAD
jgi:hypothetical protein